MHHFIRCATNVVAALIINVATTRYCAKYCNTTDNPQVALKFALGGGLLLQAVFAVAAVEQLVIAFGPGPIQTITHNPYFLTPVVFAFAWQLWRVRYPRMKEQIAS